MASQKLVVVAGDLILDHHLYEGRRHHYGDGVSPGVRVKKQVGGAGLIHDLLVQFAGLEASPSTWQPYLAARIPSDLDKVDPSQHAYAFWRPYPSTASSRKQTWRVSEAMGFGAMSDEDRKPAESWPPAGNLPSTPHTVILSDGGMGFRKASDHWEQLNLAAAQWIVLKSAAPLFEGPLWEELIQNHSSRLILAVSARELRKCRCRISEGLSWESTLVDVLRAIEPGNALSPLNHCRHALIAFESEGGVWIDFRSSDTPIVHFVYDAATIEGEHAFEVRGTAFGFLSCLTAAVVRQLLLNDEQPDFETALEGGLSAMRDLREKGHGPVEDKPDGFPASRLAKVIQKPVHRYSRAIFPATAPLAPSAGSWSLLAESQKFRDSTAALAGLYVTRGPLALENLPHLAVGHLLTVERDEIESLRTLAQLIRHYEQHDAGKKPLSIGVFGPPGAGKSFAVKELSEKLIGKEGWLEFNLSQFDSPADLIGAFHQIRDRALQNIRPVAFFDEFDSQQYRWLQYLLAPMQDGRFQEGQLTHPLGKCVLIFAGGTSWTFETFGPPGPRFDRGEEKESDDYKSFRLLKGPDFKSRLDGFFDVIGPNRRQISPAPDGCPPEQVRVVSGHRYGPQETDIFFPIRRALMIRGEFRISPEKKLDIDDGLLRALLTVEVYRHGSRSLNKVLQPFKLALPGPLNRSQLSPQGQLAMHTDAEQFLEILEKSGTESPSPNLNPDQIQTMGEAIHRTYEELGLKDGWLKSSARFEELGENQKDSNLAAAKRMVTVLGLVGIRVDPTGGRSSDLHQIRQHLEFHLELLADAEHEGWMQWHLENGWRYAPLTEKDNVRKLHPLLIPYGQLTDKDKNKDRNQIRNYPQYAQEAGMSLYFEE